MKATKLTMTDFLPYALPAAAGLLAAAAGSGRGPLVGAVRRVDGGLAGGIVCRPIGPEIKTRAASPPANTEVPAGLASKFRGLSPRVLAGLTATPGPSDLRLKARRPSLGWRANYPRRLGGAALVSQPAPRDQAVSGVHLIRLGSRPSVVALSGAGKRFGLQTDA